MEQAGVFGGFVFLATLLSGRRSHDVIEIHIEFLRILLFVRVLHRLCVMLHLYESDVRVN